MANAKFKNILDIIINKKKLNNNIEIKLTKEDIFNICEIRSKDKIFNYNIRYISNWISSYLKYHVPEIKVLLYYDYIYITDNSKGVIYDNIHTRYPSSNMYKHKFDFEVKKLNGLKYEYKNCGISNTFIPECGAYIITTENGQYVGSSINICNKLRGHVSLSNKEGLQQFKKTFKIRSPIKLITIYECLDANCAKHLEEKLISDLDPKLNNYM